MKNFDASDYLETPEDIVEYLESIIEDYSDVRELLAALRVVVHSRGFTRIARNANLNREHLYRAFGDNGNPTLATVTSVMKPLGIRFGFQVDRDGSLPSDPVV